MRPIKSLYVCGNGRGEFDVYGLFSDDKEPQADTVGQPFSNPEAAILAARKLALEFKVIYVVLPSAREAIDPLKLAHVTANLGEFGTF